MTLETDMPSFTLQDAQGESHSYRTALLPARQGIPLSLRLVKALGGPLFALLGEEEGADVSFASIVPALQGLDPVDLADMGESILSTTMRDGALLTERNLDVAYRGNYEEWYRAVWEVVRANRMIPLLGTSLEGTAPE